MNDTTEPTPNPPEQTVLLSDFSRRLIANTFFNFIGRFWSFAATILLTPYILRHLTDSEFGVWVILSVLLNSVMNSAGFLDLGLGSSFVKFISDYHTRGEYGRMNKVLTSGLIFYILHGILFVSVGLALEGPLFSLFRLSPIGGASRAYMCILVACAAGNVGVMFSSVFRGVQRMDKANAIDMVMGFVSAIGTVLVLQANLGLRGLALNALMNSLTYLAISWLAVRRSIPGISLRFDFDSRLLREMFFYGAQILVSRLGGLASFQLDKLIVARFLGVASLKFYEVSVRMAALMRALPLLMMSALIPAASELGARNDKERIIRTYHMTSKYITLITVGLVGFVLLEADSLLRLWLGPHFDERSVILIQILAIGYGANVLGGAASQIAAGVGRPEFDMQSTILLAILSPLLGIALVQQFGAPGAAAGTALALIISAAYLLVTFHRKYVQSSVEGMFRNIHVRPAMAGFLAICATAGFHHAIPSVDALSQVWYLIPAKMALDFVVFSPVYVVFLMALKQITGPDLENFMGLMNFGFEFLRHPFRERVKIYR